MYFSYNFSSIESKNVQHDEENDIMLEPAAGVAFTMNNSTRVGPKKVNPLKYN